VKEEEGQGFSITPQGELLREDHPQTLKGVLLLEEGPEQSYLEAFDTND
jgi:hypothetical protein